MQQAIEKADTLIEALAWIREFRGKTTVIKLGGSLLGDIDALHHILLDILFMESVGMRPVVVHGGGKKVSAAMEEAGIEPRFVQGRRYTDDATLEIVEKVLATEVNHFLAAEFEKIGGRAMTLNFESTPVLKGEPLKLTDDDGNAVDLGHVGVVTSVDQEMIESLSNAGKVPFIPSMAITEDGYKLNVNADTAATNLSESQTADVNGNLIGSAAGGGIINPQLNPLAGNGRSTQTHALRAGSPAIDAGNSSASSDQRGFPFTRSFDDPAASGTGVDIGAFELQTLNLLVDNPIDEDDGIETAGDLSLREAIRLANGNAGTDTIAFDQNVFTGEDINLIRLTQGELTITESLSIDGTSVGGVVITGDRLGNDAIFSANGTTNLGGTSAIGLRDNSRVLTFAGPLDNTGPRGDLTLTNLTITGGRTTADDSDGGGILFLSNDTLTLNDTLIIGNSTAGNSSDGGGVSTNTGSIALIDSIVSGNESASDGGGIRTDSGSVSLIRTALSGNISGNNGGGIVTVSGSVSLNRGYLFGNTSGDTSDGSGGAIFTSAGSISLTNSAIGNNTTAENGGGIRTSSGSVSLINSTLNNNTTTNEFGDGGAIYTDSGSVSLTNSTLSGNTATGSGSSGGGIRSLVGDISLTNSTITGNSAASAGGIVTFIYSDNTTTVTNSIIAGNMSDTGNPDLRRAPNQSLDVNFSLIGDNTGTGLAEAQTADSNGNFIGSVYGSGIIDPLLGPLTNNGGPTLTHALLPGSLAIDSGQ